MDRKIIIKNFFWIMAERCGAQFVTFVVSIILARLLDPEAYGTVALMLVITSLMDVFVEGGLGTALIQKKDADDLDFSTVFYFNILFCFVLYIILFIGAPFISDVYNNERMTAYIRVIGLTVVISGTKNVQNSYMAKNMMFKKFFIATLAGTIVAAIVGISVAFYGGGVWALVAQYLSNNLIDTIILWIIVKWRPKLIFSFERLKSLYSFGWKLLVSSLLGTVYSNLRMLIIGKMYSETQLAYYNRGESLPRIFVDNINSSINSVLFPTMALVQDDQDGLKTVTRRCMKTSIYVVAPMLIGLAVIGKPIVCFLLTDKWLPCVPFMQIFCVSLIFYPLHTSNLNALKAMGRSDLFLKLEIIKKTVDLVAIGTSMWFGVMAMAYSVLFTSFASQIINSWPNKKLLNYGYLEQLKDIIPSILMAIFMGICIYPIQLLGMSDIVTIMIQIPLGVVIYIAGSAVFKLEAFAYLWAMVRSK